jgi:succinate dehydrogenase/fumarate reductase flavoprotein subunit
MSLIPASVDVLILGGGLSGLSAALHACMASPAARILLVEKTDALGGSSQYSSGMFWAPRSVELAHQEISFGDPELQRALIEEHPKAVEWMRQNGVRVSDIFKGIMSIGIGYPIDIHGFLKLAERKIHENPRATILKQTWAVSLDQTFRTGPVTGAVIVSASDPATPMTVRAKSTIITTGGFQGSPQLTSRHIGPGADNIFIRSNRGNTGDGFTFATDAGAGHSRGMSSFYGHLLPSPLQAKDVNPFSFLAIAQFQSNRGVLVNKEGRRFCDETMGDEVTNQEVAKQSGRVAYLILSDEVRKLYATGEPWPNAGDVDRVAKAREYGGHVESAATVQELVSKMAQWGLPETTLRRTIDSFNVASRVHASGQPVDFGSLDAPIGTNEHGVPPHAPLVDAAGPYWVLEVQPSLTLTYGGIKINKKAHALTQNGLPIPNLYVAGIDAGGFSNYRYCAGLVLAFVTGKWAGTSAAIAACNTKDARGVNPSRL